LLIRDTIDAPLVGFRLIQEAQKMRYGKISAILLGVAVATIALLFVLKPG